jgi:hypothetical protein
MTSDAHTGGGFFSQPRAVWAVAFASVVSFMGLGRRGPPTRRARRRRLWSSWRSGWCIRPAAWNFDNAAAIAPGAAAGRLI